MAYNPGGQIYKSFRSLSYLLTGGGALLLSGVIIGLSSRLPAVAFLSIGARSTGSI